MNNEVYTMLVLIQPVYKTIKNLELEGLCDYLNGYCSAIKDADRLGAGTDQLSFMLHSAIDAAKVIDNDQERIMRREKFINNFCKM